MDGNGKETKQEKKQETKQDAGKGAKAAFPEIKQKNKKSAGEEKTGKVPGPKKRSPKGGKTAGAKKISGKKKETADKKAEGTGNIQKTGNLPQEKEKKTAEFPKEKKASKGKKKTGKERYTKEKDTKEKDIKEKKRGEIEKKPAIRKAAIPAAPDSKSMGAGSGKTAVLNKKKKKPGNPNLKLVKNGDLPMKEDGKPEKKKKETEKKEGKEKKQEKNQEAKTHSKPEKKERKDIYQESPGIGEWFVQHKSLIVIGFTCGAFILIIFSIYHYIVTAYEVTTVYVDGNIHYTNEEVMNMVMGGRYGNNSLYLSMKYKDKGIEGIPFVEKMDVHILTPHTIRISVYEKALAGYVEYLGRYMYFDKDGIVVESSENRTSGIPQVTGLKFDYVVLNELLPVENDEIFKRILDITQLLNKYEIMADKIFFDSSYDLTLFFGDVRVTLGTNSGIDQKIIRLKNILPELEGKKGTLQMDNYTEDKKNITFHQE